MMVLTPLEAALKRFAAERIPGVRLDRLVGTPHQVPAVSTTKIQPR